MTHKDEKIRLTVEIYHHQYTIKGDEDSSHVQMVASLVDQKMREIHEVNKLLDTRELAVLTAVNVMNDYLKLKEDYVLLQRTLKEKED